MTVTVLATVGVVLSTLLVGGMTWGLLALVGVPISPIYCLLFGALISPTDPIAVLSLLKRLGCRKAAGSDHRWGILVQRRRRCGDLRGAAGGGRRWGRVRPGTSRRPFSAETVGGAAFGLATGYLAYRLIKSVDDYQVEILLSVALVAGGSALANALHLSGPIAMAVAGLLIGNQGRLFAMSPTTVERLDVFWELIDGVLNAVLFVLLGLAVLAVTFTRPGLTAGLMAVPIVLLARFASVGVPVWLLRRRGRPVERSRCGS